MSFAFFVIAQNSWAGLTTSVGVDVGGDELAFIIFENGARQTIKAGDGLFLNIGYQQQTPGFGDSRLHTALSLGYKGSFITTTNALVDFSRINASVMQYFSPVNRLRFGTGITGHFHNTFSIEENSTTIFTSDVNNTLGAVVSVDYGFGPHYSVGMRFTMLEYTDLGEQFSGNSIGFYFATSPNWIQ